MFKNNGDMSSNDVMSRVLFLWNFVVLLCVTVLW